MLQMINSLRNNKRSRKTLFDQSTKHKGGQTHRKKDIDPNALAELKLRLKEEKRRRKIRMIIALPLSVIVLIALIYVIDFIVHYGH